MLSLPARIALPLTLLLFWPAVGRAQTKPAFEPAALADIRQELGETPQLIFWVDAKTLRSSAFYAGMANSAESLFKKAFVSSKCMRKTKLADFDHALLLGSDFDTPKERGYLAVSGSFDAPKLLKCLASELKWNQTQEGGTILYEETSGTVKSRFYAAGPNVFVLLASNWAKPVAPGTGKLGKGQIAALAGVNVLAIHYEPSGGQEFKIMEGTAVAGTDLDVNGHVVFNRTQTAIEYQKKADAAKQQIVSSGLPVSKNIRFVRTNKRIDAHATVTTSEFVLLMGFIENALGGSGGSNTSAPPSSPGTNPPVVPGSN